MKYLLFYLLAINLISFIAYGIDKRKAIKNKWRIKEATLLGLSFIGGSIGALMGMIIFHHKTKKPRFKFGVPVMLIFHLVILFFCYH
ncbi:MAG: DUF1294 domain-containing protein [Lachnospiraceae bacterium]|nr:DUF1294 domain-containing protein [Lachnospiraceae bacterium]